MSLLDPAGNSSVINLTAFAVAAGLVWLAGFRLSVYVELIADRTGIGKALAGAVLLGGATSLPEIATTVTAAASSSPQLAGMNLLGGLVMQIAVLAAIDAVFVRHKALTTLSPEPALLIQGIMLILLTAMAAAAISSGELFSIAGVGLWPVLLAGTYVAALWIMNRYENDPRWEVSGKVSASPQSGRDLFEARERKYQETSTARLWLYFAMSAVAVLVAGFSVARLGEALAEQTGLGQSFVGATLVAIATSLPEVSTTWSAVRMGAFAMAAANILGTNAIEIALFLPAEVIYRGGPIFDTLDSSASFLAALGVIVTAIYVWGLLERRGRTVFGMGVDSLAVLVVYLGGLLVLYHLGVRQL